MEKSGKVPTQSQLNTFVSTALRAENRTGKLLQENTLQQEKGVRRNTAQLLGCFPSHREEKKKKAGGEGGGHN